MNDDSEMESKSGGPGTQAGEYRVPRENSIGSEKADV
jgi:hypothetical protein